MKEQELLQMGIGRRLVFLGRAADMVSVSLSPTEACPYQYDIHISANCEILQNGKLLTSTKDVYTVIVSTDKRDITLFDERIKQLLGVDKPYVLKRINYDSQRCLYAEFSGNLEIRSLPDPDVETEEKELWRIFFPWKAEQHLVATQTKTSLEQYDYCQEELDRARKSRQSAGIKGRLINQTERRGQFSVLTDSSE